MIKYREYDPVLDYPSLVVMMDRFFKEVHREDMNRYYESEHGFFNGIHGKICQYESEGCRIRLAIEDEKRPIGFLIYHLVFDTILIVRGIYFEPEHRKKGRMLGIVRDFVKSGVKRVISQTFEENEPKEISGEKPRRKLLRTVDGMNVWENVLGE